MRWIAIVLTCAACSNDENPEGPPLAKCDPSIVAPFTSPAIEPLGEHGDELLPIVDNDNLDRVRGPQGGQHFYVHVRVFTDASDYNVVSVSLRSPEDLPWAEGSTEFATCASEWTEPRRITVFMDSEDVPLAGRLVVETVPDQGSSVSFEAPVTIWDSKANQPPPPPPSP